MATEWTTVHDGFIGEEKRLEVPTTLRESNHWVLRKEKKPVDVSGNPFGWNKPEFWISYDEAINTHISHPEMFDGIGFVVAREPSLGDEQIIGGDIDNSRDPVTGEVSKWAQSILDKLNCPTSISISGTGFRFFCKGKLPNGANKVIGNGPDDLTDTMKAHIATAKPSIMDRSSDQPVFNGIEIYEHGPRHLTITGEWLPEYPCELENKTPLLCELAALFPEEKKAKPLPNKAKDSSKLPYLDIQRVINTSGFVREGDELVGPHPIFGSSTGKNLKVNPDRNVWSYFHAGSECGGDPWLWLAAISGTIEWVECGSGALRDANRIQKVKEYAVSQEYFAEEVLFPERAGLVEARETVESIRDRVLEDTSLPFEPQNLKALAVLKQYDLLAYERTMACWKGHVRIRNLEKAIGEQISKTAAPVVLNLEASANENISLDQAFTHNDEGDIVTVNKEVIADLVLQKWPMRHIVETGELLVYYDGRYIPNARKMLHKALTETLRNLCYSDGRCVYSRYLLSEVQSIIEGRTATNMDAFDRDLNIINVANGLYNWQTGEFKPHDPEYLSRIQLPIIFDPTATCTYIDECLSKVLKAQDIEKVREFIGFIPYRGYPTRKGFILYGPTGTGKS